MTQGDEEVLKVGHIVWVSLALGRRALGLVHILLSRRSTRTQELPPQHLAGEKMHYRT